MLSSLALFTSYLALSTSAANVPRLERRAQCAASLTIAESVATTLQAHYYDSSTGQYNGGSLWTDANAFEDLHNLMLGADIDTWSAVSDNCFICQAALNPSTDWVSLLGGANDDSLWVILSLWKIADYKSARGLSNSAYLDAAATIYNLMEAQVDDTCGGGIWWSTAHTYKNAVTNELFIYASADGFLRGGGETYLNNAIATWNWLSNSGMRNSQGLFNDGLTQDGTCVNNGETTWIYNQGVIASGLAALYAATGSSNATLLDQAEITLDATVALLTENDILKESCDDALSGGTVCDADQQLFKGLWTKHVQYYLDMANDAARTAKYSPFLGSQMSAVFHFGTDASDDVGSVWYAPSQGGSIFTPKTSTSGLEAHISAAKYGPC